MIDLSAVGAFPSFAANDDAQILFGLYLPGVRSTDGFSVVVRIIDAADRFNPVVKTQDEPLVWVNGSALDLWATTVTLNGTAIPVSMASSRCSSIGRVSVSTVTPLPSTKLPTGTTFTKWKSQVRVLGQSHDKKDILSPGH